MKYSQLVFPNTVKVAKQSQETVIVKASLRNMRAKYNMYPDGLMGQKKTTGKLRGNLKSTIWISVNNNLMSLIIKA